MSFSVVGIFNDLCEVYYYLLLYCANLKKECIVHKTNNKNCNMHKSYYTVSIPARLCLNCSCSWA